MLWGLTPLKKKKKKKKDNVICSSLSVPTLPLTAWNGRTTIGASGPSSLAAGLLEPRRRLGVRVARRGRRSARVRAVCACVRAEA